MEGRAESAIRSLLDQVAAVRLEAIQAPGFSDGSIDLLAHVGASDRLYTLVCAAKANGQPSHVRVALLQLRRAVGLMDDTAVPVLIAPYLSPRARALCREHEVCFLDLEGNVRLVFDGVFIERTVPTRPPVARRDLKSLFKPKSARVMRVLFREPSRAWRVAELARESRVSLGHVSNVRASLLAHEWARISSQGLLLSEPDSLLDAWRDAYQPTAGRRMAFYTTLHGRAFEDAARRTLGTTQGNGHAIFASFSAAHWLAPFGRTSTQHFYADDDGSRRLTRDLNLSPASKGENVVVVVPKEEGVFFDTVEPTTGAICTSPAQTYLDLWVSGERGREAADHLRRERLTWRT
jgi:hypothetical protein